VGRSGRTRTQCNVTSPANFTFLFTCCSCNSCCIRSYAVLNWHPQPTRKPTIQLTVTQLVKKFPDFYGNRRFITVFTRTRHWSLSWARWIQFTISHLLSVRCFLILSSHLCLGLPGGLFSYGFPTKILYAFLIFHPCYMPCPSYPTWLYHTSIAWGNVQITVFIIMQSSPASRHFIQSSNILIFKLPGGAERRCCIKVKVYTPGTMNDAETSIHDSC
jgi:hypothetical protein